MRGPEAVAHQTDEPKFVRKLNRPGIAATLPLGSVGYENKTNERGERLIWLDHAVVTRQRAMRGPGESYSDAILRLVADAGSETASTCRGLA
jgi:hypothetical protein